MPQKDPEARRAYMKAWAQENRDRLRESQRRYQEQNRERIREQARKRYQANREQVLKAAKERNAADPNYRERKRLSQAKRRAANPERERELTRRRNVKNKYGLTLEEYYAILARGCAICGATEGERRLCMDHDHANGKIRDALCQLCNTGIGALDDDPSRLRAAADYLEKHRT